VIFTVGRCYSIQRTLAGAPVCHFLPAPGHFKAAARPEKQRKSMSNRFGDLGSLRAYDVRKKP